MERATQGLVSTRYWNSEIVINEIKDSKNNYQNEIEDFVDKYTEVVNDSNLLDEWSKEVKNIAEVVKKNTINIRKMALHQTNSTEKQYRPVPAMLWNMSDRIALTNSLRNFTQKHGIGKSSVKLGEDVSRPGALPQTEGAGQVGHHLNEVFYQLFRLP